MYSTRTYKHIENVKIPSPTKKKKKPRFSMSFSTIDRRFRSHLIIIKIIIHLINYNNETLCKHYVLLLLHRFVSRIMRYYVKCLKSTYVRLL